MRARQNEDKESLVSYASQVRGSAARRLTPEFSAKEDLLARCNPPVSTYILLSFSLRTLCLTPFPGSLSYSAVSMSLVFFLARASVFALEVGLIRYIRLQG